MARLTTAARRTALRWPILTPSRLRMFPSVGKSAAKWALIALAGASPGRADSFACFASDPAGLPIPAQFELVAIGGKEAGRSTTVRADSTGTTTFRNVAPGTYRFDCESGRICESKCLPAVDRLRVGSPSTVSGVVLEGQDSAVKARLCFTRESRPQPERCTEADGLGIYSIDLEGGRYAVRVTIRGQVAYRGTVEISAGSDLVRHFPLPPKAGR